MLIVRKSLWKYMRIVPQADFMCQQLASFDLSWAFNETELYKWIWTETNLEEGRSALF